MSEPSTLKALAKDFPVLTHIKEELEGHMRGRRTERRLGLKEWPAAFNDPLPLLFDDTKVVVEILTEEDMRGAHYCDEYLKNRDIDWEAIKAGRLSIVLEMYTRSNDRSPDCRFWDHARFGETASLDQILRHFIRSFHAKPYFPIVHGELSKEPDGFWVTGLSDIVVATEHFFHATHPHIDQQQSQLFEMPDFPSRWEQDDALVRIFRITPKRKSEIYETLALFLDRAFPKIIHGDNDMIC
ncbi:MAG: hypothetical protein V1826_03165 [bacterium]